MIKIENVETYGWEAAIRGMRNPMNSWERSDSCYDWPEPDILKIGPNDLDLMTKLAKGGSDDRKYMRMIGVTLDITAPLYWWKEFDTYKVGTVANSCSTMHKIQAKEFTLDDFSHDHLLKYGKFGDSVDSFDWAMTVEDGETNSVSHYDSIDILNFTIDVLNNFRDKYNETHDKKYWWQMIQLLPSSYNQRRTVMLNYEVLKNIYPRRSYHKLDEWREFCKWIETLPYSEIITGKKEGE